MNWFVEFNANDKVEAEEYSSIDMAKAAYKDGRKLFLNLAEMTPDLKVSGTITEIDSRGKANVLASFANKG